jgi:hypothetical protein
MRFRLAVVCVSVALAACDSTPAQHATATTPPAPRVLAPSYCSAPVTAIYALHVNGVNGGVSGDSIFCVSAYSTTDFNTLAFESPVQDRLLLAADTRSVVMLNTGNADRGNSIEVLQPISGVRGILGTLGSFGVGDPGPLGAEISPDGTELALGGAHKLLVIGLDSRAVRTLAADPSLWLMPIRWTPAGLIARKVGFEGMGDFGLLNIEPASGTVSVINQGPNNQLVLSPDGRFLVTTTHVDLGDGPTVRYPWQNAIDLTGPDGHTSRLAMQKDHWFTPLDVTNDGKVLFSSDSQTDPVAPGMGLYLAVAGQAKLQLPSTFSGQWVLARFANASNALVAHLLGGTGSAQTGLGFQVLQMCPPTETGCQVQWSGDATYDGQWPTTITSMVMLPAPA